MSNANNRDSLTAIISSKAYLLGWMDYQTGLDSSRELARLYALAVTTGGMPAAEPYSAMRYSYGRLAAARAERTGVRIKAPNKRNLLEHEDLLRQTIEAQDAPSTIAVIAHRVEAVLQELCGTIPPRQPWTLLTFRRGLPIVPTLEQLQSR